MVSISFLISPVPDSQKVSADGDCGEDPNGGKPYGAADLSLIHIFFSGRITITWQKISPALNVLHYKMPIHLF